MEYIQIRKILNGETEAFEYFVREYKDSAFSIAISIVKNEFDARDVVQEAFLKAFKGLKNFRKESSFSTWFTRILINESYKFIKREQKNYQNVPHDVSEEIVEEVSRAWDMIIKDERQFYIRNAIQKLPPKEAMALTLYYMEEYSLDEICNVSGLSASHVKVLLFRGRRNLYIELSKTLKNDLKTLYQ